MSCVNSVRVVPSRLTLTHHDTFSGLQAIVDTNGSDCCGVRWTSGDTKVVKVNGQTGAIEAVGVGTTYVKAKAIDGSGKYGCCTVTVEPLRVEGVKSCPDNKILDAGSSAQLRALIEPARATNRSVRWVSANPNIATVDDNGWVTGIVSGTTYVTVITDDGNFTDTCNVKILEPEHAESITLSHNKRTVKVGETSTRIGFSVEPSTSNDRQLIWTSSDPDIATVDELGRVTGKMLGKVVITATTKYGRVSNSITFVVVIDNVRIVKDGEFNKIIFESTNKEWLCINHDLIHYSESAMDDETRELLQNRFEQNYYTGWGIREDGMKYYDGVKEYTDEEIKLLYALDPYGLAKYVQKYGGDKNTLAQTLSYKDSIFYLLFNRWPTYYFRSSADGSWYPTNDVYDLNEVASESEFLFGMHPIWDGYAFREALQFTVHLLTMALGWAGVAGITAVQAICWTMKKFSMVLSLAEAIREDALTIYITNSVTENHIPDIGLEGYSINWAYDLVTMGWNLQDLAAALTNTPKYKYYKETFYQCTYDTHYGVFMEINGQQTNVIEFADKMNNL